MANRRWAVGCLSLLLLGGCVPHVERGETLAERASRSVPVIRVLDADSPNITLHLRIQAGSARDPIGREGLANLALESVRLTLEDALAFQPALVTGKVEREDALVTLTCPKRIASTCIEAFVSAVTLPEIRADRVETSGLAASRSLTVHLAPVDLGREVMMTWLYEAHPFGHPPAGRVGVLPLLEADDVHAFHRAHYVRSAMVVGLGGAFEPEHHVDLVEQLEAVSADSPPESVLQRPLEPEQRAAVGLAFEGSEVFVAVGQAVGIGTAHPDWAALEVGLTVFDQPGGLRDALRDGGLGELMVGLEPGPRQSAILVSLQRSDGEAVEEAIRRVISELERLAGGITEAELSEGRKVLETRRARGERDTRWRTSEAVRLASHGVNPSEPGLERVNAALGSWLRPGGLRVVVVAAEPSVVLASLIEDPPPSDVEAEVSVDGDEAEPRATLGLSRSAIHELTVEEVFR